MSAAQSGPGDVDKYLDTYVHGGEEAYREAVGADRLAALGRWSESTDAWQEIFA